MLYENNTPNTWAIAKENVNYELSKFSELIDDYQIVIDGTNYHDTIALNCESKDEYEFRKTVLTGEDYKKISDDEFNIRHRIKDDNSVYISINIKFKNDPEPVTKIDVIGSI